MGDYDPSCCCSVATLRGFGPRNHRSARETPAFRPGRMSKGTGVSAQAEIRAGEASQAEGRKSEARQDEIGREGLNYIIPIFLRPIAREPPRGSPNAAERPTGSARRSSGG